MKMLERKELLPREIVEHLDKYIIGQNEAKKAVAIALRNRIRRQKLPKELAEEITPKNIIMIGPTGVGKTEIARRLAKLANAPFVKVEASKFTEVGYVGRDVESMIRDLVRVAIQMVKETYTKKIQKQAREKAIDRVLDILFPAPSMPDSSDDPRFPHYERMINLREEKRKDVENGLFDDRKIEVEVKKQASPQVIFDIVAGGTMDMFEDLKDGLSGLFEPPKKKSREMTVKEAIDFFTEEEAEKMIDMEKVKEEAIKLAENNGIIFLDEIDKITSRSSGGSGPDVSREGVQRDLLPIIEGSTVPTKYGIVRTDHILFIAAGAFHIAKPSDLIPELQGRFPIRVELHSLTKDDFVKILTQPKNALIKQYQALMETENVSLVFEKEAIETIAEYAYIANDSIENIGARRLHTIMEKLLEDILFKGPELSGTVVTVDKKFVEDKLKEIISKEDVGKYIL
ncbi:ATP-dependent HslUV protease ATP-binding subunit HslU [Thermotomaculum hydrothermale]|uniref:ATP-dependent protease ATPase subunit HslU n=2 Tax=Thermotomaculum hydrothermale TaxID=981385 RepID=A0A7R6SY83_9BACT|nr:ATP-dependent HslUV protease ATP-binding subunit HslU [Thermotomaculum hydrothermale]